MLNIPAISESSSSETGHCSDESDSGRVCTTPLSSVLFDGIPTLTGLEGDMWASHLLALNTSTSSANITFDFTNLATNSYSTIIVLESKLWASDILCLTKEVVLLRTAVS